MSEENKKGRVQEYDPKLAQVLVKRVYERRLRDNNAGNPHRMASAEVIKNSVIYDPVVKATLKELRDMGLLKEYVHNVRNR